MRYGTPYKGSKNKIAKLIVEQLPEADCFVDLFAGGCAITHAAMLSGKYKTYIANDISTAPSMFKDAINGKYADETRWISREDFFRLKDSDNYVKYCWSFGNNGRTYLYGKEAEPWKKALHYARVYGDCSLLKDMGIESDGTRADIKAHAEEYRTKYTYWQSLQSLESLERLQSLESLERLEIIQSDYKAVKIPENSVVYCDIPYRGTNRYDNGIDYEEFYDWCCRQTAPIFVSEYWMPEDRFATVWEMQHRSTLGNSCKTIEKLFRPINQIKGGW